MRAVIYAACFGEHGELLDFAEGRVEGLSAEFDRPLSERWFVYLLDGGLRPLAAKSPLSPELRDS